MDAPIPLTPTAGPAAPVEIGLALSGGGVRSLVFHLGLFDWLVKQNLWNRVTFVSTVSGGSLGAALVFQLAGKKWPTAQEYIESVQPRIRELITGSDLEAAYKRDLFLRPWLLLRGRAFVLAKLIRKRWKIDANVSEMPMSPRWIINTTCYETGKNFRFMQSRMGDYESNYVLKPEFPLAEATAASAAVPGLIGPLVLKTKGYSWVKYPGGTPGGPQPAPVPVDPLHKRLQLWDGGVYDNLGLEALFKPGTGFREGFKFLIVSDASRPLGHEFRRFQWGIPPYIAPIRLVDAATDQVRALRARSVIDHFTRNPGSGAYLRMGNTAARIFEEAGMPLVARPSGEAWLVDDRVAASAGMATTLRQLTNDEFDDLQAHGFEVANTTLHTRCQNMLL